MTKILDRLYERSHIWFAVGWIIAYVMLVSWADSVSLSLGVQKSVTFPALVAFAAVLGAWALRPGNRERYGLVAPTASAQSMLWYLPLALLVLAKLAFNAAEPFSALERVCFAGSMLCVGFLEELIFRGLLYRAMDEEGHTKAVVVSSLTFGIGHIVNLFNASGQELLETIAQIAFAVAVGFMLVMVLERSGSLWPPILFHGIYDACSVLEAEVAPAAALIPGQMTDAAFLVVAFALCAGYLALLVRSTRG